MPVVETFIWCWYFTHQKVQGVSSTTKIISINISECFKSKKILISIARGENCIGRITCVYLSFSLFTWKRGKSNEVIISLMIKKVFLKTLSLCHGNRDNNCILLNTYWSFFTCGTLGIIWKASQEGKQKAFLSSGLKKSWWLEIRKQSFHYDWLGLAMKVGQR